MADAGDERAAAAGGHGRLRASGADRERVVELLKVAFVQGRLTQDELDTRVGQALASRTYADLAGLTGDIPAGPASAGPVPEPAGSPARTLAIAARRAGMCLLVAFALLGFVVLTGNEALLPLAVFPLIGSFIAVPGILGYGVVDAWQQRRSSGQLPPPRRDGRTLDSGRARSTGRDPAPPRARTRHTSAELRTHRPGRDQRQPSGRGSRAPRGIRPLPDAV